jgi:hypothetical protein
VSSEAWREREFALQSLPLMMLLLLLLMVLGSPFLLPVASSSSSSAAGQEISILKTVLGQQKRGKVISRGGGAGIFIFNRGGGVTGGAAIFIFNRGAAIFIFPHPRPATASTQSQLSLLLPALTFSKVSVLVCLLDKCTMER